MEIRELALRVLQSEDIDVKLAPALGGPPGELTDESPGPAFRADGPPGTSTATATAPRTSPEVARSSVSAADSSESTSAATNATHDTPMPMARIP